MLKREFRSIALALLMLSLGSSADAQEAVRLALATVHLFVEVSLERQVRPPGG
jgi:hypothetical protein